MPLQELLNDHSGKTSLPGKNSIRKGFHPFHVLSEVWETSIGYIAAQELLLKQAILITIPNLYIEVNSDISVQSLTLAFNTFLSHLFDASSTREDFRSFQYLIFLMQVDKDVI